MVAVQRVREREAASGVAFGLPGLVGPLAAGVGGAGLAPRSRWSALPGVPELELGDPVPQRGQGGQVRPVSVLGSRPQCEVRDLAELAGDGGDRGRDRVLPRCRRMPLPYREFWHPAPTVPRLEWGIPGGCGEAFESFWSRVVSTARLALRVPRGPARGAPPQPPPCATREQTATPVVPLPVAAPFNPMTTRSREEVSTPARWRSLLDHRRAATAATTARPAPYLSPSLRLSTDDDPQPRGGLDTRSLALAARPPESWRASSTTADAAPGRRSRHPLAGARCSTTSAGAFQPDDDPQPRGGLDTRSLALAARPPEAGAFQPMTTRSREEVSTPLAGARCSTTGRLARLLNHRPAAPLGPAPSPPGRRPATT